MNKLIVTVCAACIAACASQSETRRPAATARTEPAPHSRRAERVDPQADTRVDPDTKQRSVRPVAVAPVDRAAIDERRRDVPRDETDRTAPRDETARDLRDRRADDAVEQGNSASDLENARKVRGAVMDDKSLSFSAKNAQIVSNQGEITLRGRVKNEHDKRAIETYARQVVGTAHVHNELITEQ